LTVDDKAPATAADHPDTAAVQARVAAAGRAGPGPAAGRRWLALTLVLVPALLVLVVHDVAYLLRAPLWTDETWVAASTRFSLLKLPQTTSSTPIGWSVLLRLVTVGGTQVVGIAAFGAVGLVQLARRAWRRLAETAVAAAGTAVLMTVIYEAFDARAVLPGLTYSPHFRYFYLPVSQGWPASITFLAARFDYMRGYFGLGPLWLAALLFAAGLVTIYRLGRPATAVTLAALWPEMLAVSALHKYPFLDERTSTFLFAVTVVTAAMGVVGVCCLLRPWLRGALAATVAVAAVAAFALGAQPYLRRHPIPAGHGDIRGQTQYIAAHAAPGDVILVNLSSNWGFAYYWPAGRPSVDPARSRRAAGVRGLFPGPAAHRRGVGPGLRRRQRGRVPGAGPRPGAAGCLRPDLAGPHARVARRASRLASRAGAARAGSHPRRRRRPERRAGGRAVRRLSPQPWSGLTASCSTVCSSPQVNRARYRPGCSASPAVNSVLHRVGASSPECRTAPNRRSTSPTTHPQGRRSATVFSSGGAQSPARTSHSCTTAPPGTAMVSNHSPGHSCSSHWVISQVRSPNSRSRVSAGRPSTMR
jgi:hypothetical protein